MLTPKDLDQLSAKGITPWKLQSQLLRFEQGFPYMRLLAAARPGNGILVLDSERQSQAVDRWRSYLADGGEVVKMVPASGAASRMFKALFAFLSGADDVPAQGSPVKELIDNIDRFPFRDQLDSTLRRLHGLSLVQIVAAGRYKDLIAAIVNPEGMNYGNLPKGLLSFHSYPGSQPRTPLEEQLVEGASMACRSDGTVHVHFTVSPDHRELFNEKLAAVVPGLEASLGVKFVVTLSEQKQSTDTVAVDLDNEPVRDADGNLQFRPGGHGALIENLNELDSAVVFLKNIDNVVPDSRRADTIRYKEVLGGFLIETRDKIAAYLERLNTGRYDIADLREMIRFLHDTISVRYDEMKSMEDAELALYIKSKFNRPLRVCGMVRNEGEPGGGPFLAFNPDGSSSPQILESHQIDPDNKEYQAMVSQATHFNPVDLVCYTKDADGRHYDLTAYVDNNAGFISSKSIHGVEVKALELPGLWNGAMSDWNTVFVEVPISTFNPVKTVNDLLRPAHQSAN